METSVGTSITRMHPVPLALVLLLALTLAGQGAAEQQASEIIKAAGVPAGLVVQLGCGDGRLAAGLYAEGANIVQVLDKDVRKLAKARDYLRSKGLYGPVSVERLDGRRLPYAENLVNLIVADGSVSVPTAEMMRVLVPGGVAYVNKDGRWTRAVKPRTAGTDEWTHYLHDAGGNAVAHDEVVGPPRHTQWIEGPRHTRSHEHIPGIYALVSAGGRIFYIADEAAISSIRQLPRWRLVARDAYNGLLLWKRPVSRWYPHIVNWGMTPRQLQRKLVAVGERVYVTLGLYAPLSAVDAASGDVLKVYDDTRGAEEIVCHEARLLVVVRSVTDERIAERRKIDEQTGPPRSVLYARETAEPLLKHYRSVEARASRRLVALDASSGRKLWEKGPADMAGLRTMSLCAAGGRVFYQKGGQVLCLELETGRQLWSASAPGLRLAAAGRVVCTAGSNVVVLSADTGKTAWRQKSLLTDIRDVFIAGGSLWLGGFKPIEGKRGPSWGPYFASERDMESGKLLKHIEPANPGHHHRCWQNKATDKYILAGRRGVEFIDLESGRVLWNSWVRGVCRYGIMPCNGLLYAPPHACGCYISAKLTGFYALAPASDRIATGDSEAEDRLERGPAYASKARAEEPASLELQWPTYRHDGRRSGGAGCAVAARLRRLWLAGIGGRITSPTVAAGKAFVASVDEYRLCAVDAETGRKKWEFLAGGRIDSPPTIHRGRAVFGCRDGCVYSLGASDGRLAWRLRPAGASRRIVVNGRLESVSPVAGSVLVDVGVGYFAAGRSSYLDGGIKVYRIDPTTGDVLSKTSIYSPDPETGRQPEQFGPAYMPGALGDILSCDARNIYLRDTVLQKHNAAGDKARRHLFAATGFLDDSWPHRSYWMFATRPSMAIGCSGRDRNLIYGRLLCFDDSVIYGYGRTSVHWSNQLQDGKYRLFARSLDTGAGLWARQVPIVVRAMLLTGKVLFVAGPAPAADGSVEDGRGALLLAVATTDGAELARYPLEAPPVTDGMAAAAGRLYISLLDGRLLCLGE